MRILFNLFPERERSRATGLLEGPVKRAGGAIGNILSLAAIHFASAIAVGYVAIPIALTWLVTSLSLWRRYPALLLRASTGARGYGDDLDISEMIDPNTVRVLSTHLAGAPIRGPRSNWFPKRLLRMPQARSPKRQGLHRSRRGRCSSTPSTAYSSAP